jgi:hypothetical protein
LPALYAGSTCCCRHLGSNIFTAIPAAIKELPLLEDMYITAFVSLQLRAHAMHRVLEDNIIQQIQDDDFGRLDPLTLFACSCCSIIAG